MVRHKHHFKIAFALAIAAGSWGVYWLPQRIFRRWGTYWRLGNNFSNDDRNFITYTHLFVEKV